MLRRWPWHVKLPMVGGTLTSLYAGVLIENNYSIYGLYTFASPSLGNSRFVEQLNASVKGHTAAWLILGIFCRSCHRSPFLATPESELLSVIIVAIRRADLGFHNVLRR